MKSNILLIKIGHAAPHKGKTKEQQTYFMERCDQIEIDMDREYAIVSS